MSPTSFNVSLIRQAVYLQRATESYFSSIKFFTNQIITWSLKLWDVIFQNAHFLRNKIITLWQNRQEIIWSSIYLQIWGKVQPSLNPWLCDWRAFPGKKYTGSIIGLENGLKFSLVKFRYSYSTKTGRKMIEKKIEWVNE